MANKTDIEDKKEWKPTGKPLTKKEFEEWEKSFTDIEDSIKGLKGERHVRKA